MSVTAEALGPVTWKDPKRHLWILSLTGLVLPFIGAAAALATGWDIFWFVTPIYVYGLIPLLDVWIGEDRSNPPEGAVPGLEADPYYRRLVIAHIPLQYVLIFAGAWALTSLDLSLLAKIGLVFSIGISSGGGINAAHELGHKKGRLQAWLARLALAPSGYGHFYVEHNRGHHVRVATFDDPASARYGENLYGFWIRTVSGSLKSAWNLERTRLQRKGLSAWSWRNQNFQGWILTVVLFAAVTGLFGWAVLPWLLVQMVIGFLLLETVNYIEHYGLLRQRDAEGKLERPRPEHSWNSNHIVSNLMLYQLQRHSDHHAHGARAYQALRHMEGAPQLPAGYATMIMLAGIPPLWRRVMDPKVRSHYRGDMTLANVQPGVSI
ncbi:MAG: alkane 1-monooxygenase [Xanthomonadales bacterium]|nr:alkane 1-monooxygenase [Xanthomonadales bacterium]